jgi:hypothetical protein
VIAGKGVDEPAVQRRWDNGEQLDNLLMIRRKATEPAQDGIDDSGWHARTDGRSDQLAHKVGIAVTEGVDLFGIQGAPRDERAYGCWLGKALRTQMVHLVRV